MQIQSTLVTQKPEGPLHIVEVKLFLQDVQLFKLLQAAFLIVSTKFVIQHIYYIFVLKCGTN